MAFMDAGSGMRRVLLQILVLLSAASLTLAQEARQDSTSETAVTLPPSASRDSVLKSYTVDDLLEYKDFFERDRLRVESERVLLREKGIRDMETFLTSHPQSEVLDKVIVRLAELYYEKALEGYTSAQEQYSALLEQHEAGQLAEKPVEPVKDYSRTLELYDRIISEHPQSSLLDDARYNVAFLTEDLGKKEEAVGLYEKFIEDYPESRYTADALFRVAEYYFNPPLSDLERAIEIYQKVLSYGDSPKFDEALYRLGWAYYKLSDYPKAISFFTLLADDLRNSKELDPDNKITNPSLAEESIEYIGISFLDFIGANGAASYLTELGGREYGIDILQQIGDIYMNVKEEYENAIQAYRLLLRMHPNAPKAPMARAKIAEAYRLLENEQMAYLQRDSLFMDYRDGTSWWTNNTVEEVRAEGRSLAERALRENVNLLVKRAEEYSDPSLYAMAVTDSRKYLTAFPKDTMAALIHWNLALTLDSKLMQVDEAFKEYIDISNLYWNSRFQKMAAENAIALAQEIVQPDSALAFPTGRPPLLPLTLGEMKEASQNERRDLRQALELEPIALTAGEEKLALALSNYIKLFPHELNTSERLAQAGALYYNKNSFGEALKYFKTLLKHFPDCQEAPYAQYLVMESYFGKLDYKSCEVVAKRIKLTEKNQDYVVKAEQRLAESIFLQAENLARIEQHVAAGEEYRRVYEEVPTAEFADLALYNGGLEFDQAHEYRRAIETYTTLSERFAKSMHYLGALTNMAHDYNELDDHLNAALTFEKLSNEEPDSSKAEVALYNASVSYVRAEDWQRAIRANRKFVDKYPGSNDADDLFYDIANYHLKLDDLEQANVVYGEYAQKFPSSPRVVETFYRRGEYYESKGDLAQSRAEYELAIGRSNDFRQRGMDYNDFFAAEALFRLTELKYRDYAAVRFKLPKAQMDAAKERKKNSCMDIVEGYTKVAGYGTLRLYEATYKIGLTYEEFALTWADQEIPEVDEARRIVARKEINQTAAELYERSLEAYKHSSVALERLNQSQSTEVADTSTATDSTGKPAKLAFEDTTAQVSRRWIQSSKDKISEVIYDIAELNHASMRQLLDAPMPENMDKITALEFRNQLLNKFVKPLVTQILTAHQRNLQEAETMGFESAWVEQSRRKIVETNNTLAREYAGLSARAMSQYAADVESYQHLIEANDFQSVAMQEEMANLIDFGRSFAKAAVQTYDETLKRAKASNIHSREQEDTQTHLLKFVHQHSRTADSLAGVSDAQRHAFEEKVRQNAGQHFQDAVFTLEDNFYSLSDSRRETLEAGFRAIQEHEIHNIWAEKIILALVRSEPVKYAQELGLAIADTSVATDASWMAHENYAQGWTAVNFPAMNWRPAQVLGESQRYRGYGASRLWQNIGTDSDSAANASGNSGVAASDSSMRATQSGKTAYFRKSLRLTGLPVSGQIQLLVDDSYNLFVNGEYIAQVVHKYADSLSARIHDFSNYLKAGGNTIAIEVRDTDNSGGYLEAVVFLKSLPGWEERQAELQARKAKQEETLIFERGLLPNMQ